MAGVAGDARGAWWPPLCLAVALDRAATRMPVECLVAVDVPRWRVFKRRMRLPPPRTALAAAGTFAFGARRWDLTTCRTRVGRHLTLLPAMRSWDGALAV